MKMHRTLTGILLFFFAMISPCFAEDADTELLDQITALLNRHDSAFAAQDLKGVMGTFISGPQIFLMGTGPGEMYREPEGIEAAYTQFFNKFEKGTVGFTYNWVTAGSMGDLAWFAAEYAIKGKVKGETKELGFNVSGTLQRQEGEWLFLSRHFSRLGVMAESDEQQPK